MAFSSTHQPAEVHTYRQASKQMQLARAISTGVGFALLNQKIFVTENDTTKGLIFFRIIWSKDQGSNNN